MLEPIAAIGSALVSLILMIAVFVGAYYFSKFVANGYQGNFNAGNSKIQILERKMISKDQSLLIVQINDKVWFLSCTGQNISKIDLLDGEAFEQTPAQSANTSTDFFSVLSTSMAGLKNKKAKNQSEEMD